MDDYISSTEGAILDLSEQEVQPSQLPPFPLLSTSKPKQREKSKSMCDICGKYVDKSYIKNHIKMVHKRSGSFICSVCSKCFHRQHLLNDHMNSHYNRQPYICPLNCGHKYSTKAGWRKHYKHCKEGKPRYKCIICKTSYSCRASLRDHHLSQHENKRYQCVCGYSFKWRSHLKAHRRNCLDYNQQQNNA